MLDDACYWWFYCANVCFFTLKSGEKVLLNAFIGCFYFYFAVLCVFVSILMWIGDFFVVRLCVNVFIVISFPNNYA
ncbi:hypothetical protein D3C87_305560 [compost metagenome]